MQNQLLKQMKINLMIVFICMVYTFFKSKFVSSLLRSFAAKWSRGHQESAVYKTADYVNVYIISCYFTLLGLLLLTDTNVHIWLLINLKNLRYSRQEQGYQAVIRKEYNPARMLSLKLYQKYNCGMPHA